ncbi:methionyl-tRNA formyltransferase [Helicobacter jaachi]|uniref:Methionyl-tRNA formyltransferase n=1 Tax=Helicobacter jaachi TaxID=1677920 RepID=A0A4U8TBC8_9HELI|nr:formyltransferase family protein [Helicobacter jaachi]TLD96498.1 methionyl-tRNA formyltransferase [Helicobacter jaachi]
MRRLKIGYFADGIWAHNAFRKIIESKRFEICFVTPRFDSTDNTLLELSRAHNIPCIKAKDINSSAFFSQITHFNCDIFVSMSFNQIFKEPLISTPRLKTINCHAGKLPFYRGRNILNWVLINDEKDFGITVHFVDSGIDSGDIILQRSFPISDSDDYSTLLHTAHTQCAQILYDALCLLQEDKATPIKQDSIHKVGFYCPARVSGDEWINWHKSSREIFNFIRALNAPDLGAKSLVINPLRPQNTSTMRIFKAQMIESAPDYIATPGAIVGIEHIESSLDSIHAQSNTANKINGVSLIESSAQSHTSRQIAAHTSQHTARQKSYIVKTLDSTLRVVSYECERALRIGDRLLSHYLTGGGKTKDFKHPFSIPLHFLFLHSLYWYFASLERLLSFYFFYSCIFYAYFYLLLRIFAPSLSHSP